MKSVEELEALFKQNGWDKYLHNLYDWVINGKDINVLIKCIKKKETIKKKSDSKYIPTLKLKDVKEATISFDTQTLTYNVETPEISNVGVRCPPIKNLLVMV